MTDLLTRVQVLFGAALTWLIALAAGLTAAAEELAELAPEGGEPVVTWLLRAVAVVAVAVAAVRRVTPVPSEARGLLPSPSLAVAEAPDDPFWTGDPA